jgi:hypothetical protein
MTEKRKAAAKKSAEKVAVKAKMSEKSATVKKESGEKIKKISVPKSERLLTAEGWKRKKDKEKQLETKSKNR